MIRRMKSVRFPSLSSSLIFPVSILAPPARLTHLTNRNIMTQRGAQDRQRFLEKPARVTTAPWRSQLWQRKRRPKPLSRTWNSRFWASCGRRPPARHIRSCVSSPGHHPHITGAAPGQSTPSFTGSRNGATSFLAWAGGGAGRTSRTSCPGKVSQRCAGG